MVDAVRCALDIQRGVAERNAEVPADRRIEFRVGINLGDVIIQGDDIYGDGVNVAARLEGLADVGGVVVSGPAFDQARNKIDAGFEYLGEQQVKSIPEPVRVYRLHLEPGAAGTLVSATVPKRRNVRWLAALAAGSILLIAAGAVGWRLYLQPLLQERAFAQQTALPLPDKPSIAVLPFNNLSGDAAQDYFSDGMTENLITNLSKLSGLFVIARNTVFTYKDRAVNVPEVGGELGVRYVLEGSVQKASDRVRIHAQLIDAATGFHVWAEHFDRRLDDVFALQDEVASAIVAALEVELSEAEQRALAERYTDSLEAYDAFLQGWERVWRATYEANERAREHFERAIRLDPRFARAYAALALTYTSSTGLLLPEGSLDKAYDLAQIAVTLDDSLPQVNWALAEVHLHRGELEQALTASNKVLSLDPTTPTPTLSVPRSCITLADRRKP